MQALAVKCRWCNSEQTLSVKPEDLRKWQNGELIQRAMPYLKPYEREILISGTCEGCYKKLFGDDEDE